LSQKLLHGAIRKPGDKMQILFTHRFQIEAARHSAIKNEHCLLDAKAAPEAPE